MRGVAAMVDRFASRGGRRRMASSLLLGIALCAAAGPFPDDALAGRAEVVST